MKSYIGVKPFTEQKTICKVERQSNRFSIEFIFFFNPSGFMRVRSSALYNIYINSGSYTGTVLGE